MKVPILARTRLTVEQFPKAHEEREHMAHVPYASVVGYLMYTMVCTWPNIAHVVGLLRRCMTTLGK